MAVPKTRVPVPHDRPFAVAAYLAVPAAAVDDGFGDRLADALQPSLPPLRDPERRAEFVSGLEQWGTATVYVQGNLACGHPHGADWHHAALEVAWNERRRADWSRLPIEEPVGTRLLTLGWRPRRWDQGRALDALGDASWFADRVFDVFDAVPGSWGEAGWWETLRAVDQYGRRGRWSYGLGQDDLRRWGHDDSSRERRSRWGGVMAETDRETLPWKAIRLGLPNAVPEDSLKSPRVAMLVAGVDIDDPSGPDGCSLLDRFLEGEWGDPGAMTVVEARRHLAEWANGHPDQVQPRCYPFVDRPASAVGPLRAFLTADWRHGVLGLHVTLLTGHPSRPTVTYDREQAKAALAHAAKALAALGVRTRPRLHLVPSDALPGPPRGR